MTERFANDVATTLNGTITSGATSLVVTSATGFPAANFRIRIDDEYLLVTAVAGTTWTVTRAMEGSAAAAHSNAAAVPHVLTAGGLAQALAEASAAIPRTMTAAFTGTRTTNSYADVDSTNGKATLTTTGGDLLAFFFGSVSNNNGSVVQHVGLRLDAGSDVGAIGVSSVPGAGNYPTPFCVGWLFTGVSAAAHSVYARHTNDSISGTMSTAGFIILLEVH